MQMALIARIQHPYIVEFKEAWVEKVRGYRYTTSIELTFFGYICFLFVSQVLSK